MAENVVKSPLLTEAPGKAERPAGAMGEGGRADAGPGRGSDGAHPVRRKNPEPGQLLASSAPCGWREEQAPRPGGQGTPAKQRGRPGQSPGQVRLAQGRGQPARNPEVKHAGHPRPGQGPRQTAETSPRNPSCPLPAGCPVRKVAANSGGGNPVCQ